MAVSPAEATAGLDWRRPHPLTILVEIGNAFRSVVAALVVLRFGVPGSGGLADTIELVVIAIPLMGALGRWYTTRYALDAESFHHHYGLLWRQRQVLPRANIQNVSTTASIVARLGSVVELQVSDASSDGDIRLRFVSRVEAERLTTLLRSTARAPEPGSEPIGAGPAPAGPPIPPGAGHPLSAPPTTTPVDQARPALVEPSLGSLVWAEATSIPSVVLVTVGVVGAVGAATAITMSDATIPDGAGALPWLGVVGAGLAPIAVAAIVAVSRVFVLGGFRLDADPDRLRIKAGLLTEARVAARRERLQLVRIHHELVHRHLGLERVTFETADVEGSNSPATRYLTPVGPTGAWRILAAEAFGDVELDERALSPVSRLTVRRTMVRAGMLSALGLGLAPVSAVAAGLTVAAVLALGWLYARARFRRLGWAMGNQQLLVRDGVVLGRLTLVRLDKIQSLRTSSSLFQRRLGLSTLHLSTAGMLAGGLVTLPDLPTEVAEDLLARLASRAARTPVADTL